MYVHESLSLKLTSVVNIHHHPSLSVNLLTRKCYILCYWLFPLPWLLILKKVRDSIVSAAWMKKSKCVLIAFYASEIPSCHLVQLVIQVSLKIQTWHLLWTFNDWQNSPYIFTKYKYLGYLNSSMMIDIVTTRPTVRQCQAPLSVRL